MHLALARLAVKIVAVVELPAKRRRERAPNRRLAGARHSHHDYDHDILTGEQPLRDCSPSFDGRVRG